MMIERCRMFIINQFRSHKCTGIERNLMFKMAADAGVYTPGTYGSDFSRALSELCEIEYRYNESGKWVYNIFKLKEAEHEVL